MRTPSDLPPRQTRTPRMGDRGRWVLIVSAVLLVVFLLSARTLSGFYIDYLWHGSVDRSDVFWGVIGSKVFLFVVAAAVFITIAVINLLIADRLAPSTFSANMHPIVERFHEIFGRRLRLVRYGVAVLFGILFALPASGRWQDWLLFRNSQSFGVRDPQFDNDIGFYIFQLPFITFVLDWLYAAVIFITLLVLLTHVLNGGVLIQPPRPKIRRATKAHLAVLLALLALLKAADYWVSRYELTTERRGFVQGATYAVVNAQLPALMLLILIALLVAGLFLSTLKTGSWRLPIVASALWVVLALLGGVIYPAAVQALVVNPNQKEREEPYIRRNVLATRQALGIGNVAEQTVSFESISTDDLREDLDPLRRIRLINPGTLVDRFRTDQGQRSGLTIRDLDVDRYEVGGEQQQMLIAARELDLDTIANKSWQGRHLISTHGCGLVRAPAHRVESSGRPDYEEIELERPELYFGEALSGYAVVRTGVNEEVCPGQTNAGPYQGDGGIALDSVFKRISFALSFLDYNLIGSSAVDDDSQLLWIRNVRERVEKVAPFLAFDGDPYPVALGGGVTWVIDGYTTSGRYPYAENADLAQLSNDSGLDFGFNYVRNSVKATVDAYTGEMNFYVIDPDDPIIRAWANAFSELFEPMSAMPEGLVDHLRYPEDLFRVQTAAYSKYRLEPEVFFDRTGAWSVAQGPSNIPRVVTQAPSVAEDSDSQRADFASEATSARFVPYYSMFRAPDEETYSFQLLRPFVPFSTDDNRKELQAFMLASSEPETYGQMRAYIVQPTPTGPATIDGPATVAATIENDITISGQITLLDQTGSSVFYGDLQMVPIGGGILYVRPLYVRSDSINQLSYRYILVSYEAEAAFGTTLQQALAKLFPGFREDLGDVVGVGTGSQTPVDPADPEDPDDPEPIENPIDLLEQADDLFNEAEEALRESPPDFATYAEKNAQARDLVERAIDLLDAG